MNKQRMNVYGSAKESGRTSAECLLSSHMKPLQNWWSSHRSCSTTSLLTEGKPGGVDHRGPLWCCRGRSHLVSYLLWKSKINENKNIYLAKPSAEYSRHSLLWLNLTFLLGGTGWYMLDSWKHYFCLVSSLKSRFCLFYVVSVQFRLLGRGETLEWVVTTFIKAKLLVSHCPHVLSGVMIC